MSNTTPTQKVRSDGHVQTYHEGKSKPAPKNAKSRQVPAKPPATPTTGKTGIPIPQLASINFNDKRVPDHKHVESAKYQRNGSGDGKGHMVSIVNTGDGRMLITDFGYDANNKNPETPKGEWGNISVMNLDDLAKGDMSRSWRGDNFMHHRGAIYRRYIESYYQNLIDNAWVPTNPLLTDEERDDQLVEICQRYADLYINDIENAFINDEYKPLDSSD